MEYKCLSTTLVAAVFLNLSIDVPHAHAPLSGLLSAVPLEFFVLVLDSTMLQRIKRVLKLNSLGREFHKADLKAEATPKRWLAPYHRSDKGDMSNHTLCQVVVKRSAV